MTTQLYTWIIETIFMCCCSLRHISCNASVNTFTESKDLSLLFAHPDYDDSFCNCSWRMRKNSIHVAGNFVRVISQLTKHLRCIRFSINYLLKNVAALDIFLSLGNRIKQRWNLGRSHGTWSGWHKCQWLLFLNIDYSRCFVYQKLNRTETFSLFVLECVINSYPMNNERCWIQTFQKDDDSRMFLTWHSVNGKISKNVLRFSNRHVS